MSWETELKVNLDWWIRHRITGNYDPDKLYSRSGVCLDSRTGGLAKLASVIVSYPDRIPLASALKLANLILGEPPPIREPLHFSGPTVLAAVRGLEQAYGVESLARREVPNLPSAAIWKELSHLHR